MEERRNQKQIYFHFHVHLITRREFVTLLFHVIKKNCAIINGEKKLNSADCISSDLRTTFSIILGAIAAKGSSTISRIYHGLRGYSNLQLKLRKLGIKLKMKT